MRTRKGKKRDKPDLQAEKQNENNDQLPAWNNDMLPNTETDIIIIKDFNNNEILNLLFGIVNINDEQYTLTIKTRNKILIDCQTLQATRPTGLILKGNNEMIFIPLTEIKSITATCVNANDKQSKL